MTESLGSLTKGRRLVPLEESSPVNPYVFSHVEDTEQEHTIYKPKPDTETTLILDFAAIHP